MPENNQQVLKAIEAKIGLHQDYPKPGILFRDVLPLFQDVELTDAVIYQLYNRVKDLGITHIVGIEMRGVLFGLLLAQRLRIPFTCARKKNKLPGKLNSIKYDLEYGSDVLELQRDSLPEGSRCLIVDDLLATGGTMKATKKLVEISGSLAIASIVVIDLVDLHKPDILGDTKLISLFRY